MVSKVVFKKIKFNNIESKNFDKYIIKKGLFVFPAGPALAKIEESFEYYESIKKADLVFFDSGFFVLLLKVFKNISVVKFSGYKFLKLFFNYLKKNKGKKVFCIDPNIHYSRSNRLFFKNLGINNVYNYLAPKYDVKNFSDKNLLRKLKKIKPDFILTNISGGKQEILGKYLKENLKNRVTVLCTGGAISFFTKDQAPINTFIDELYLGWLVRLIFNPMVFFSRFMYVFKLIPMVIFSKIKVIK